MTTTNQFTSEDLINAVATFNADPYCVWHDELAQEILKEIEEHGVAELTPEDGEDYEQAKAQLELNDNYTRTIYQAGGCKFALAKDLTPVYYICMTVGNKSGYVVTAEDVENDGWVNIEPENFAFETREEAEATKAELEDYAQSKGYENASFQIEESAVIDF